MGVGLSCRIVDRQRERIVAWTLERKREACLRASMSRDLVRPDTVVVERRGWYQLITPSAPGNVLNEVVFSQLGDDEVEETIDRTVHTYRTHGRRTKWCVGFWTKPGDFGEHLARRGFTSWDVRGMGCETTLGPSAAERIAVAEVTEDNLDTFIATMLQGWSLPAAEAQTERRIHLAALRAVPRSVHLFIAHLDEVVVGTAGLILRGDCGYFLGTQVLEAFRGRGAYRALVASRLAFLRNRGVTYAVTQAREATSAPRLERLGFETLFRSKCYLSA